MAPGSPGAWSGILPPGDPAAEVSRVTIYDPTTTRVVLDKAVAHLRLHRKLSCRKAREEADGHLTQLLGDSAPRRALRQQMARLVTLGVTASGDAPTVLIRGETGTGTAWALRSDSCGHGSQSLVGCNLATRGMPAAHPPSSSRLTPEASRSRSMDALAEMWFPVTARGFTPHHALRAGL